MIYTIKWLIQEMSMRSTMKKLESTLLKDHTSYINLVRFCFFIAKKTIFDTQTLILGLIIKKPYILCGLQYYIVLHMIMIITWKNNFWFLLLIEHSLCCRAHVPVPCFCCLLGVYLHLYLQRSWVNEISLYKLLRFISRIYIKTWLPLSSLRLTVRTLSSPLLVVNSSKISASPSWTPLLESVDFKTRFVQH